jgi:hypothetical protein
MLSDEDCHRILGDRGLSDEQIATVRDTLNAFALVLVDEFLAGRLDPPHEHP